MAEEWGGSLQRHPHQVRIQWSNRGNLHQTGFHLVAAGTTVADVDAIRDEVSDFVTNHLVTIIGAECTIVGADIVDLQSGEGSSWSPASLTGSVTTLSSDLAMALCVTVSMKGELRRKYGQGRMYWPVPTEAWADAILVNATAVAAYQAVIAEMTSRWIDNDVDGYNLVNVHGLLPARPATPTRPAREQIPPTFYEVTSLRLNTAHTFLRSRRAGVGS